MVMENKVGRAVHGGTAQDLKASLASMFWARVVFDEFHEVHAREQRTRRGGGDQSFDIPCSSKRNRTEHILTTAKLDPVGARS